MSADLVELDDDQDGNSVTLEMNVHGYAFLRVSDGCESPSYAFPPDEAGTERALARALQGWAEHVRASG